MSFHLQPLPCMSIARVATDRVSAGRPGRCVASENSSFSLVGSTFRLRRERISSAFRSMGVLRQYFVGIGIHTTSASTSSSVYHGEHYAALLAKGLIGLPACLG